MTITDKLKELGYIPLVDDNNTKNRKLWHKWYKGKVNEFHNYKIYNGKDEIDCERSKFGMAKMICETWADLLWNRDCYIQLDTNDNTDDKDLKNFERILKDLKDNNFTTRFSKHTEITFAEGTTAIVGYADEDNKPELDFLTADYIYPLKIKKGEVVDCAFVTTIEQNIDGKIVKVAYFMIHEKTKTGYIINNKYFSMDDNDNVGDAITFKQVKESYETKTKRFAILTPAIVNNDNYQSPFGISIFANHIDNLKNIDLAYDGTQVSMKIGRPRIGVTAELVKIGLDGEEKPLFDTNDTTFYHLGEPIGGVEGSNTKAIVELTTEYRADKFEESLKEQVNLLTSAVGLGGNTFNWEEKRIATATQVVSENSVLARSMRKHQDGLRQAIVTIIIMMLEIEGLAFEKANISVQFDDSVTVNRDSERQQAWNEVLAGKLPYEVYLVEHKGYSEAEAKKIAEQGLKANQEAL